MESVFMTEGTESRTGVDARKFSVMRRLATLHECTAGALCSGIDASEAEIHWILDEMLSNAEVQACAWAREKFALTRKGRDEYMSALASIYELPE